MKFLKWVPFKARHIDGIKRKRNSNMSSEPSDFGFSNFNWAEGNAEHIKMVEAEYKERLTGALAAWSDLDQKARFLLTAGIGLLTVLAGWAFSQGASLERPYAVGMYVLLMMLCGATVAVAQAAMPRRYPYSGVTPENLDVVAWAPFLRGDDGADVRVFSGMRIKEYARAITIAEKSNADKSSWMRRAIVVSISAVPAAALAAFIARALLSSTGAAIVSPLLLVSAALVTGLALGTVIGRLTSRW